MYNSLLLVIFCAANGVLSSSISFPCKLNDIPKLEKLNDIRSTLYDDLEKMANDLRPIIFSESPEHGIQSSDPVFVKEIVGDFPGFKYEFHNNFLVGLSRCVVSNIRNNKEMTKSQYDLNCPKLSMTGIYDLKGQFLGRPAQGNGDYSFTTGKYYIHIELEMAKSYVDYGTHLSIENFKLTMAPQEPVKFDYKNLFNGQKDLADAFMKFNNENWRQITESIQGPVLYASFKNVLNNTNKYLNIIAFDCIKN